MDSAAKTKLIDTIIKGLPGRTSEAYTMSSFVEAVSVIFFKSTYPPNLVLFYYCGQKKLNCYLTIDTSI